MAERFPGSIGVTGAGGFLGRALLDALLARSCHVHALLGPEDRELPRRDGLRCWRGDIDSEEVRSCLEGVDAVVHLAGIASVQASFDDPLEFVRVHVGGTAAVANLCAHQRVPLVYISSAEVYGGATTHVPECAPFRPTSPYAAAKASAELVLKSLVGNVAGATILRPFLVYGPGQSPRSVVGTAIAQARTTGLIDLRDYAPVRDFVFVRDVVALIVASLAVPPRRVRIYNAGSGVGRSIREMAETVAARFGARVNAPQCVQPRRHALADVRAPMRDLGWWPEVSFERGIELTAKEGR